MSTPALSKRARMVVDGVIAAYDAGGSYNTVGREFKIKVSAVQTIMRKYSPGSIRTSRGQQLDVRLQPKRAEEGLTLAALGQSRVGPCRGCGVLLVAETRENPVTGQTCGLCLDFAAGGGPREWYRGRRVA